MRDFWSKRRAGVEAEERAERRVQAAETEAQAEARLAAREDDEILTELGLPEPEALNDADAIREFLTHAVPRRLKQRALRRMWRLNPVLANLDGLNDYEDDYTDAGLKAGPVQTAYQVGKGMLRHLEALAEAEARKDAPEETAEPVEVALTAEEDAIVPEAEAEAVATAEPEETGAEETALPLRPRRMTFTFEEQRA